MPPRRRTAPAPPPAAVPQPTNTYLQIAKDIGSTLWRIAAGILTLQAEIKVQAWVILLMLLIGTFCWVSAYRMGFDDGWKALHAKVFEGA